MTEVAREATTLSDTYIICYICYLVDAGAIRGRSHRPRAAPQTHSNVINLDTLSFAIVYV